MELHFVGTMLCVLFIASASCGAEEDAKAARVLWAAFECSRFALMSGQQDEANRLFLVGLRAGTKFLDAAKAGSITQEEAKRNVPLGVSLLLDGPSDDFVIGRIYESAINNAFDSVVKRDAQGLLLESNNWVSDPKLEVSIAKLKYQQANCDIL